MNANCYRISHNTGGIVMRNLSRLMLVLPLILVTMPGAEAKRLLAAETITATKSYAIPSDVTFLSVVVEPTSGSATVCAEIAASTSLVTSCVPWTPGTVTAQASSFWLAPVNKITVTIVSGTSKVLILGETK